MQGESSPPSPSLPSLSYPGQQSITEVLQNPRTSSTDTADLGFEIPLPTALPVASEITINDFEEYLRLVGPFFDETGTRRRSSVQYDAPMVETELNPVPREFFDSDFCPLNASQLVSLLESAQGLQDSSSVRALNSSLAVYLSTLYKLLREALKKRSDQIDTALARISSLRERAVNTLALLSSTREKARELVVSSTHVPLKVSMLKRQQGNADRFIGALERARRYLTVRDAVKTMIDGAEYKGATEVLNEAKLELWSEPLGRVHALDSTRKRVMEAGTWVRIKLQEEFRSLVAEGNLGGIQGIVQLAQELEEAMSVGESVDRCKPQTDVTENFGELFVKEEKGRLKAELAGMESMKLAMETCVRRAVYAESVLRVLWGEKDSLESNSASDRQKSWTLKRDLCYSIQECLCGVLKSQYDDMRLENIVRTDSFDFVFEFGDEIGKVEAFAEEVEHLFGVDKTGALRAAAGERSLQFIDIVFGKHSDLLKRSIENERWAQVKVDKETQSVIYDVMAHGRSALRAGETEESGSNDEYGFSSDSVREAGLYDQNYISVGSEKFKVVSCALRYVRTICGFALFSKRLTFVAAESSRRATELTRIFNSCTAKAILNAAALKTAGLKSITARHLALSSRSLAMALALNVHVGRCLQDATRPEQRNLISMLVTKIDKDLKMHQGQLLAKILSIMMDRLSAHLATLKKMKWEDKEAIAIGPDRKPSPYMLSLIKESTVLHRIVWSILLQEEVAGIFGRVCASYGSRLSDAWARLSKGSDQARERVKLDADYMHSSLGKLDVFGFDSTTFRPIKKLWLQFRSGAPAMTTTTPGGTGMKRALSSSREIAENEPRKRGECETDRVILKTEEYESREKAVMVDSDETAVIKRSVGNKGEFVNGLSNPDPDPSLLKTGSSGPGNGMGLSPRKDNVSFGAEREIWRAGDQGPENSSPKENSNRISSSALEKSVGFRYGVPKLESGKGSRNEGGESKNRDTKLSGEASNARSSPSAGDREVGEVDGNSEVETERAALGSTYVGLSGKSDDDERDFDL